jgi:hypothetical protein
VKSSVAGLAAVVILALAVWTLFYVLTPDTPLTPPETAVVVGSCAVLVFGGKWLWSRLRKPRGGDEHVS